MALTDAQKAKVRRYLGFPDVNREPHSDLEGAMTSLSAEGETEVVAILAYLATLDDTLLPSSWTRQMVEKAEEVTLRGFEEVEALRSEARRYVETLAAMLDVTPLRDVFGSGGITGVMING